MASCPYDKPLPWKAPFAASLPGKPPPTPSHPDEIQEALSAASLAQLVLQQVPRGATPPPSLRAPLEAAAALAGADFGGTVARLPARALGVLEAAMQVISAALWIDPRGTWALVMGAEAGEGGDSPRATR